MSGSESLSSSLGEDQPLSEFLGHDNITGNTVASSVQQPVITTSPSSDQLHFQVQIVVRPMTEAPGGADVTVTALSAGDHQMLTPSRDAVVPSRSQHAIGGRDGARTPRPGARSPARTAFSLPLIDNHATQRINLMPSTPVPWNSGTAIRSPSPARNYGGRPANTVSPRRATIPATRPSRRVVSKTGSQAGSSSDTGSCSKPSEANAEQVTTYLRTHPEFLERWIMEEVELEQLERWMIRRTQRDKKRLGGDANGKVGRKTSLSRWKFCVHADKRQMLQELTQALQLRPNRAHVLWELSSCICSAVSADGFRLYLATEQAASRSPINGGDGGNGELMDHYLGHDLRLEGGEPTTLPVSQPVTVAEFVARSREPLRLSRGDGDPRFPAPAPEAAGKDNAILEATHAVWQPMVQADGSLAGVLLMWRRQAPAFHEEDEEIARSYLVWGGIALHYAQLFLSMDKARRLNDFLLHVVKSIFQDMVSMDALVVKVMNFAQRLVDADRASLFLLDARNKELYARIFDMGHKPEVPQTDEASATAAKEIRFPLGTGIAGQVALTGEVLNIADAYSDPRFNRTVDQLTGYHTRSILCMPIFIRGLVIGVVQMVNKRSGNFTKEDEEAFETFAVYCGLALHHAKLYDKIQRSEQKYRVALEVLSYHNTCSDNEVLQIRGNANEPPVMDPNACDYRFNVFALDDVQKVRCSITMFSELFGLSRFDRDSLIRFTLTVRKNYRRVPYHNWTHGFSVANSMYSIIKHSQNAFNANESLALYIGSLCHDLDHRGKNNKFMLDTESPLACIYSTSTMEHHHFNQTVTILQQEGHNIFSKLSGDEYKQVLGHIKHCILATDLAIFFPNKAKLSQLVADKQFSWSEPEHRLLLEALAMTASDLSASAKPWDLQVKTVKVIFEEFYEQGDAERAAGREPIPMMDRNQPDQQAASQGDEEKLAGRKPNPHMDRAHQGRLAEMQVGFLNGICLPCYRLLAELLPGTKPLLQGCEANLARWQQIIEDQKKSKKQIEDAT